MHRALELKTPLTRPLPQGERLHDRFVANRAHEPRSSRREKGVLPSHLVTSVATTVRIDRFMGRRSHLTAAYCEELKNPASPPRGEEIASYSVRIDRFMGRRSHLTAAYCEELKNPAS